MSNEEVTTGGLEASLKDLLKAADATSLVKGEGGVAIEHSGHMDERGKVGGGLESNTGGIDTLMIGKMAHALSTQGFSDAQITAFMTAKMEDEEEEDEEDVEKSLFGGDLSKSMDTFREDSDIADAVDVSPFLEALTQRMAESVDKVGAGLTKSVAHQGQVNAAQAAATHQIGTLVKSMAHILDALDSRLNLIERAPAPRKGATSLSGAAAMHKSMPGEAGTGGGQLKKSEILKTLTYMNLEKGIKDIGGRSTTEIIGLFEGGNVLDPQTMQAVQGFLSAHPSEAQTARTYR